MKEANFSSGRQAFTRTAISVATAIVLLSACGGSDYTSVAAGGGGGTISGSVFKGAVAGSVVTAYALNADGTLGAVLGNATRPRPAPSRSH